MSIVELERMEEDEPRLRRERLEARKEQEKKEEEAEVELGLRILEFFKGHEGEAYTSYEIGKELGVGQEGRQTVALVLGELASECRIRGMDVDVMDKNCSIRAEFKGQVSPEELERIKDAYSTYSWRTPKVSYYSAL